MYEDTMTAPEGPSRNQALMQGLLLLRSRMQQALTRVLAGGRAVAGAAGRLIAGVGNLGAVNVARALLATPLYWARNAVAKVRPLLDVAGGPLLVGTVVLDSAGGRWAVRRVRRGLRWLAGRTAGLAVRLLGALPVRPRAVVVAAAAKLGALVQIVRQTWQRTTAGINGAVRRVPRWLTPDLTTTRRSLATSVATRLILGLGGASVLHTAGLAITGALLFTVFAIPDLTEGPQDTPGPVQSPSQGLGTVPDQDPEAASVPAGADGPPISKGELQRIYDSLLSLSAALPWIGQAVTQAVTSHDPARLADARELITESTRQITALEAQAKTLRATGQLGKVTADLASDIEQLAAQFHRELTAAEREFGTVPAHPAARKKTPGPAGRSRKGTAPGHR